MKDTTENHLWQAEDYHYHSSAQSDAAAELLQHIQFNGHEQILDIGCGDGKISAKIATYVPTGSVIGLDISPEMIHFAQRSFPKTKYPNLTFLMQDAQLLTYCDKFDVLFSSFALQWVPDPNTFFQSAYKCLKSSGYLVITIPLGISSALEKAIITVTSLPEWAHYFKTFSPNWHFTTDNNYKQLLIDNKFTVVKFATILQTVIFPSRESFEKYVIQWFSYMRPLPQELKQPFFKQIMDKYLEINPVLENGEVSFSFLRIDAIANKIIS